MGGGEAEVLGDYPHKMGALDGRSAMLQVEFKK